MVFQCCVSFSFKVNNTYDWWKLSGGEYSEQQYTSIVPIFKGIKMKEEHDKMYDDIYNNIINNTSEKDEIVVFPHMPIFYVSTNRDRATNTAIQWFDVSTDDAIINDIGVLVEKKPKVILMMSIPDFAISVHERWFRDGVKSGLRQMQEFLDLFVKNENYSLRGKYTVSKYYDISLWILE